MKKILLFAMVFGFLPVVATAQPNPFDAYEVGKPDKVVPPKEAQVKPKEESVVNKETSPSRLNAGDLKLSFTTAFTLAHANNEIIGGGEQTNTNIYVRFEPRLGYFFWDRVELGTGFGLVTKRLARENSESATETDWFLQPFAAYHLPIGKYFRFSGRAGVGFYFGSSENTFVGDDLTLNEATSTSGLISSVSLQGGYLIADKLEFTIGIDLTWLYGSESVTSADSSFASNALHFGPEFGLSYDF